MQALLTTKSLEHRAASIMRGIRTGKVSTKSDAIRELVEIQEVLEDQPAKPVIIARLTVTRANGNKVIVEVEKECTYTSFFHYYRQDGARRSTKAWIRTAGHSDGPSLEMIARTLAVCQAQSNPVVDTKLRILHKRAYRKLISASPDELGLTKTQRLPIYRPFSAARSS